MKCLTRTLAGAKKGKKGFTLIELMIVVIVVGILAAAAIPMYARAMDRARASEGKALLGTVRTHYLVETAEGVTLVWTNLAAWGIDTTKNRWWTTEGTHFNAGWASPLFKINGIAGTDIENIELRISCDTGIIEENFDYPTTTLP